MPKSNRPHGRLSRLILTCLMLSFAGSSWAQEGHNSGSAPAAILKRAQEQMYGIEDQRATLHFVIVDPALPESKSILELYWKNYRGEEGVNSKTLLITEAPIKDKGKKFLVWEYVEEDKADQWIYLPELRQVRRVQPHRHHHEGELESELVIEDVRLRRIEIDRHRLLPEQSVADEVCDVVETEIQGEHLYRKVIRYFSKKDGLLRKAEYFSETGEPMKTQSLDWERVSDAWVWKRSETLNAQSGRKTVVELSKTQVNTGLRDDQFSERALRR